MHFSGFSLLTGLSSIGLSLDSLFSSHQQAPIVGHTDKQAVPSDQASHDSEPILVPTGPCAWNALSLAPPAEYLLVL